MKKNFKVYVIIVLAVILIVEATLLVVKNIQKSDSEVVISEEEYRTLLKEKLTYELVTKPAEEQEKYEEEQEKLRQEEQDKLEQEQLEQEIEQQTLETITQGPTQS